MENEQQTEQITENSKQYSFTDDDRELSEHIRRRKREIIDMEYESKRLDLQAKIEESKTDKLISRMERIAQLTRLGSSNVGTDNLEGFETENTEIKDMRDLIHELKINNPPNASSSGTATTTEGLNYSDEDIKKVVSLTPDSIKQQLKAMDDKALTDVIKGKFGNVNEDTIKRGIKILRE